MINLRMKLPKRASILSRSGYYFSAHLMPALGDSIMREEVVSQRNAVLRAEGSIHTSQCAYQAFSSLSAYHLDLKKFCVRGVLDDHMNVMIRVMELNTCTRTSSGM